MCVETSRTIPVIPMPLFTVQKSCDSRMHTLPKFIVKKSYDDSFYYALKSLVFEKRAKLMVFL